MKHEKSTDNLVKNLRVYITDKPGYLGKLLTTIGQCGGNIGDLKLIKRAGRFNFREIEIYVSDEEHMSRILQEVGQLEGIQIDSVSDAVLDLHRGGKISMESRVKIDSAGDIRRVYTPGVATVCRAIMKNPELVYEYTYIKNTVAVVTNGTAILGLGNIGVHAGMPVMEGKAVLLKKFVGLNGIPILVNSQDIDTIVETVVTIAPSFGAIKMEDFAAPDCFEIERRLVERLDIPVMHDDQHGTAVVTLAALTNAMKYIGERLSHQTVGIVGLGAAGTGIARLLKAYGVKRIVGVDIQPEANERLRNMGGEPMSLPEVMATADVVVATTGVEGLIKPEMVRHRQVILALSNPNPEIRPEEALAAGAAFAADGRGVNNALAFPGIFKGALVANARKINNRMKIAAAMTIASFANSDRQELVPPLLHPEVHEAVARAVERAAYESGVVKIVASDDE
ncbi:MAG: NAD-dependent malic enzyme [Leptospiraceae bacterium]|nr:NAD-dependent malic enzyme [Leptospiraceae bacterium]MDW8306534.1 malic enzyme-like NAD(P)-binding protein [Leptospiraceae bacterium]